MHFIAVLNRDGGTFRSMDLGDFGEQARAIFAQYGHSLDVRFVDASNVVDCLERAAHESPGALMAGGGDGTISAAAAIAYRANVPLAVLPAGTMNLFARALKVPLGLHEAMEALAAGEVHPVDVATANGKVFVHQFAVGAHVRLVRIRESLSYRGRFGKLVASWRAAFTVLLRPPRFHAEIRTRRGVERRVTSGITVSNNPVGEGHIPYADDLDQGVLGVYVTRPLSAWDLARLAFAILIGRWKASPLVSEREVEEVTLRFPRRKRSAQAVIDGELVELAPGVNLMIHPGALKVVRPATVLRLAPIAA